MATTLAALDGRAEGAPGAADQAVVGDIEVFVREMVEAFGREQPEPIAANGVRGPGRPKVLPALALWAGVLVCVLRGMPQQSALWRLLSARGLWQYPRFPVTDQAVYNRLERDGTAPLERLFAQVSAVLATRLAPYAQRTLAPFATEVVALDQTTLAPSRTLAAGLARRASRRRPPVARQTRRAVRSAPPTMAHPSADCQRPPE